MLGGVNDVGPDWPHQCFTKGLLDVKEFIIMVFVEKRENKIFF